MNRVLMWPVSEKWWEVHGKTKSAYNFYLLPTRTLASHWLIQVGTTTVLILWVLTQGMITLRRIQTSSGGIPINGNNIWFELFVSLEQITPVAQLVARWCSGATPSSVHTILYEVFRSQQCLIIIFNHNPGVQSSDKIYWLILYFESFVITEYQPIKCCIVARK